MTDMFHTFRALTLGAVHDLLDKAVDLNSPSVLRQYIRDLEAALLQLKSDTDVQAGSVVTRTRERAMLATRLVAEEQKVKTLSQTDVNQARIHASTVVSLRDQVAQHDTEIATLNTGVDKLRKSVDALQAKHDLMVTQLNQLTALDRNAKHSEAAASALERASSLANSATNMDVDSIQARIAERNDVASAHFDRVMNEVEANAQADTAGDTRVDDVLAELAGK